VAGNRRGRGKTHDLAPLLRYLELVMRDSAVLLQRALARNLATSRDAQAEAVRYTALETSSGATTAAGAEPGSVGAPGASRGSG